MGIRLIIAYILNLVDLFFTNYWVDKYGLEAEGNPFGRWLYSNASTYIVKIGVVGALLFVLYKLFRVRPTWAWASWVIMIVYSIVVIIHIVLYIRIKLIK